MSLVFGLSKTCQDCGRCDQDVFGPKGHAENDPGPHGWYLVSSMSCIYQVTAEQVCHRLTNDGNAILREIDVAHPAAKNMIELSRTQDEECGDGTTSVIILGEY